MFCIASMFYLFQILNFIQVEESQRKLADVTLRNSWSNGNNLHAQHSAYSSGASNHVNEDEDEEDEPKNENNVDLNVSESLPPEEYREPAVDKNQKMKLQLEVSRYNLYSIYC